MRSAVFVIGDTPLDVLAARRCGFRVVAGRDRAVFLTMN